MDTGVGATSHSSDHGCLQQNGESVIENALNGPLTGLTCVAVKARSVVGDVEAVDGHPQLKTPLSRAKGAPISSLITAVTAKAMSTETLANL